MRNSVQYKILNAHKYKKYQEIQLFFSGLDKPRMVFFLLINVKMPTIVGILTFMSRKNPCRAELSMIFFITAGSRLQNTSIPELSRINLIHCIQGAESSEVASGWLHFLISIHVQYQ